MEITLAHGSGGAATGELIRTVFAKACGMRRFRHRSW